MLRPMATITHDTLDWYGWDEDGAGVHDIIGTRCDPYTNLLLKGTEYHHCCHSNLTRALAAKRDLPLVERIAFGSVVGVTGAAVAGAIRRSW